MATSVSGASSWIRSDQGGSSIERSRNAPRARGPSSRPASASMRTSCRRSRMDSSLSAMDRLTRSGFTAGMTRSPHAPILVLGGTGKTGRRVAERLARAARPPVRVGSRGGEPPFDWDDRATWAPALAALGAAYVSYYPDLAVPGARRDGRRAFAGSPSRAGARRLVLLSGRGEHGGAARRAGACRTPAPTGPSCAAAGSARTSARTTCVEPVLGGEVALPGRRRRASRSSTPTTSPTSPSPR